jgi:hypothetical protein
MPKVQEYLPEQEAQGPVGQTTPMLEQVGAYGRGIEDFGRDVDNAYSVLHQRQTQMETSDAYASVAEQRAQYMDRIQQETNNGTLDVAKVKQEYQDWTEKQYDSYSTAGGKDAFARASSRAGGAILLGAAHGKAAVMGNQARENLSQMSISNSNMVQNDPSQFADIRNSQVEAIQHQVETGALTPAAARQTQDAMDLELSKSAVRGHMLTDYNQIKSAVISSGGKIDPNTPGLNSAASMLRNGAFDSFLDSDHKKQLEQEIRGNQAAAQTAGNQVVAQKNAAYGAQADAWKSQAYDKLENNALDPAEVHKMVTGDNPYLDVATGQHFLHLINQQGKAQLESDPTFKNQMVRNILSADNAPGHQADVMQSAPMVRDKMMSYQDFQQGRQVQQLLAGDPSLRQGASQFLESSQAKLKGDPAAEYKMSLITNDMVKQVQNAKANNEPVGPLFDPTSSKYMGASTAAKYAATPQQIMQNQAAAFRGGAPTPAQIQTQPGVVPTPTPAGSWSRDWAEISGDIKSITPDLSASSAGTDFASRYNGGNAPVKAPDISGMSMSQLTALAKQNGGLTAQQRVQARAREQELRRTK